MLHFLKAAMMYTYSFVSVLDLREVMDRTSSPEDVKKYKNARRQQTRCAENLGHVYSKIVLQCSNFERPKEDESFFECIFYFTCAVVKLGISTKYWELAEEELGYVFRGESFNVNVASHEREDYLPAMHDDLGCDNIDTAPTPVEMNERRNLAFTSVTTVAATAARVAAIKDRAEKNMKYAEHVRERMIEKRTRHLKHQMQMLKKTEDRENMDIGLRSPRRPVVTNRQPGLVSPRRTIRNTLTARSPVVANILPTAQDRVYMAQRYVDRPDSMNDDLMAVHLGKLLKSASGYRVNAYPQRAQQRKRRKAKPLTLKIKES